jgi:hypothetical protein
MSFTCLFFRQNYMLSLLHFEAASAGNRVRTEQRLVRSTRLPLRKQRSGNWPFSAVTIYRTWPARRIKPCKNRSERFQGLPLLGQSQSPSTSETVLIETPVRNLNISWTLIKELLSSVGFARLFPESTILWRGGDHEYEWKAIALSRNEFYFPVDKFRPLFHVTIRKSLSTP